MRAARAAGRACPVAKHGPKRKDGKMTRWARWAGTMGKMSEMVGNPIGASCARVNTYINMPNGTRVEDGAALCR